MSTSCARRAKRTSVIRRTRLRSFDRDAPTAKNLDVGEDVYLLRLENCKGILIPRPAG
jgi:hypothetical protein